MPATSISTGARGAADAEQSRIGIGGAIDAFRRRRRRTRCCDPEQISPAHGTADRAGAVARPISVPSPPARWPMSASVACGRRRRRHSPGDFAAGPRRSARSAASRARRRRIDRRFDLGGVLGGDHRAPLAPPGTAQPDERRRTLAPPQGLIVLGKPAVDARPRRRTPRADLRLPGDIAARSGGHCAMSGASAGSCPLHAGR